MRPYRTSAPVSTTLRCVFDLPAKEAEITRLTEQSQQPGFWNEGRSAQAAMRRLTVLQDQVDQWRGLAKRANDLSELLELAADEGDNSLIAEVARDATKLLHELDRV